MGKIKVRHACIAFIAKSNNGSMEKNVIQSNQDVHVCGYTVDRRISKFYYAPWNIFLSYWNVEEFCEIMEHLYSYSHSFFSFIFFSLSLFYHSFIFSFLFFPLLFLITPCLFLPPNFFREIFIKDWSIYFDRTYQRCFCPLPM